MLLTISYGNELCYNDRDIEFAQFVVYINDIKIYILKYPTDRKLGKKLGKNIKDLSTELILTDSFVVIKKYTDHFIPTLFDIINSIAEKYHIDKIYKDNIIYNVDLNDVHYYINSIKILVSDKICDQKIFITDNTRHTIQFNKDNMFGNIYNATDFKNKIIIGNILCSISERHFPCVHRGSCVNTKNIEVYHIYVLDPINQQEKFELSIKPIESLEVITAKSIEQENTIKKLEDKLSECVQMIDKLTKKIDKIIPTEDDILLIPM